MVCDKTEKPKAVKKITLSEEVQILKGKLDTITEMLEVIYDIISEEYEDDSEDEKEDETEDELEKLKSGKQLIKVHTQKTLSEEEMEQMKKNVDEANSTNSVLVSV